jgi:hypothetical protein
LATISSALCLFLAIEVSSFWLEAIPQGGPLFRGQTSLQKIPSAQHPSISARILK